MYALKVNKIDPNNSIFFMSLIVNSLTIAILFVHHTLACRPCLERIDQSLGNHVEQAH